MRIIILLSACLFLLALSACWNPPTDQEGDPPPVSDSTAEAALMLSQAGNNGEASRLILLEKSCATCHRSTLKTAKPAALNFFNLDDGPTWYHNLGEEGIKGFEVRIPDGQEFTDSEKHIIMSFIESLKGKA